MRSIVAFTEIGVLCFLVLLGCSKENGYYPSLNNSVIQGRIMNAVDSSGIDSANVIIYDANTNSPISRTFSNAQGYYSLQATLGTYYLKVAAQTFFPSPRLDGAPVPFTATNNDTVIQNIYLISDPLTISTGQVSGTVFSGTTGISGALIVARRISDSLGISGVSGPDGVFVLYNMPVGTYSIQCFIAGYEQVSDTTLSISSKTNAVGINLSITSTPNGHLAGKITFLASPNSQVDITLVHPITHDAIPGLNTINTTNNAYSLLGIPPGAYIAWASFRNDGYVMDPDWIRKSGLPLVTFTSADTLKSINFSVTGAITISSPTNSADSIFAVPVATSTPTLTWDLYSSAKEYIIEVFDSRGIRIWGGFDTTGVIRHAQINQHTKSVVFNFDNSAIDTLKNGESYRWKIYADNDANSNVQGLISSSEDLRGLFKILRP